MVYVAGTSVFMYIFPVTVLHWKVFRNVGLIVTETGSLANALENGISSAIASRNSPNMTPITDVPLMETHS